MNYEIKKIDWLTGGVFVGSLIGLVLIIPMFFGLFAFVNRAFVGGFNFEILFFLFFPIGGFIGGFIIGAIFILIYNLIARHWQGIKLDIDYKEKTENN